MLTGILVFAIIAFVVLVKLAKGKCSKQEDADVYIVMSILVGILACGLFVAICILAPKVATERTFDQKIEMYQEENAKIEKDIDKIVKEYLEHEHDTFEDLKTEESAITLVTLFPELKSDTLVQQQLEIYVHNNAQIKYLKEEKIEIAKDKWLLYFGK